MPRWGLVGMETTDSKNFTPHLSKMRLMCCRWGCEGGHCGDLCEPGVDGVSQGTELLHAESVS